MVGQTNSAILDSQKFITVPVIRSISRIHLQPSACCARRCGEIARGGGTATSARFIARILILPAASSQGARKITVVRLQSRLLEQLLIFCSWAALPCAPFVRPVPPPTGDGTVMK